MLKMLNKMFDILLEESISFMQKNYLEVCNSDFRKHPSTYLKACILFEQYALQRIDVDFNSKMVRMAGSTMIYDFDIYKRIAPIDACYSIKNGESSICRLIMTFNRINIKKFKPFNVENKKLIVRGKFDVAVNLDEITKMEPNDVVKSVLDGGEEKMKELLIIINNKIVQFNKKLFKSAQLICDN